MLRVVAFDPSHVVGVRFVPERFAETFTDEFVSGLDVARTWSGFAHGDLVFVGGTVDRQSSLAGWGVFTDKAMPADVLAVHRLIADVMRKAGPIEVDIASDFPAGQRWATMLGFRRIGTTQFPDGRTLERHAS